MLMSKAEYAKHKGVSRQTVYDWIEKGEVVMSGKKIDVDAKWHLNRSRFGIRIDHDLASISDHSLASQSITIWHASDH